MTVHFNSSACVRSCTVESCCSLCYSLSPGYTCERTKQIHYTLRVKNKKLVCVLAWLAFSRSGYSLAGGVFPICWKGLTSLLGCSTDLLNSCVQGPRAKNTTNNCAARSSRNLHIPFAFPRRGFTYQQGRPSWNVPPPPPLPTRAALSTHLHSQTPFHTLS